MIYDAAAGDAPIQQGDIFFGIPKVDLGKTFTVITGDGAAQEGGWSDVEAIPEFATDKEIATIIRLSSSAGIVLTQDCDAARSPYLWLAIVDKYLTVTGRGTPPGSPKKWVDLIKREMKSNPRCFYLPESAGHGITERMAADLRALFQVERSVIESLKGRRRCRLNGVAKEHFREFVGNYFKRYPYNEWYPLTGEELTAYQTDVPDAEAYPWQTVAAPPARAEE